jgi:hypothetical protein
MAPADLHTLSPAGPRALPVARIRSLHDLTYWLLLGLLFTVPWTGVITLGPIGTATKAFGVVVAGMAVLSLLLERPRRRLVDAHVLAVAFTAWVVASYYWSIGREESLGTAGTMVMTLILLLLMWEFGGGADRQIGMMTAYVAGTFCTSAVLLSRSLAGYSATRFSVTGIPPNDLAFTVSVAIPMAWYVAEKVTSRRARIVLRLYVPLAVLAILLTASRSGLFTTAVGLLILPLSSIRGSAGKQVLIASVVMGSILAGWWLLPEQPLQRVSTAREELVEGDLNGRRQLWALGWQMAADRPLIGVGTGAARVDVDAHRGEYKGLHNSYLSIGVELGNIGIALFLLLLLAVGKPSLDAQGLERYFATVLFATLLVGLLPRHWEYEKVTWIVIGILVGQASSWRQLSARSSTKSGLMLPRLSGDRRWGSHPPSPRFTSEAPSGTS